MTLLSAHLINYPLHLHHHTHTLLPAHLIHYPLHLNHSTEFKSNPLVSHYAVPPTYFCNQLYLKSSFPKCVKCQSKNQGCNGNAMSGDHVLEKSSSKICAYICIYLYLKSSFLKHNNQIWHGIARPYFLEWRLRRFGK